MACAAYRQEKSVLGEKLPNLKSAIQKYIRRGNLDMAQYSAGQLLSIISAPEDKKWGVMRNVLHRIMIIALEDAGQCLGILETIEAFRSNFDTMIDNKRDDLVGHAADGLAQVVDLLVRAPKSRACSHARNYGRLYHEAAANPAQFRFIQDKHPEILADYVECMSETLPAFEAMVKYGEARSPKAYVFFWSYWMANTGIKERRELIRWAASPFGEMMVETLITWLNKIKGLGEAFMCALTPIIWRVSGYDEAPEVRPQIGALEMYLAAVYTPLDAFVLDKHTGVRTSADMSRFALEGAMVENESPKIDARLRDFYVAIKYFEDFGSVATPSSRTSESRLSSTPSPSRKPSAPQPSPSMPQARTGDLAYESQEFRFLVRAQITTSNAKQDTYAADHPTLGRVFVKGPFLRADGPEVALAANLWKAENGIPSYRCKILYLIPDMWPEGLPLGVRNTIDRSVPAPFLVTEALTNIWPPPRRTHATATWPPTEVLESDRSWDPVAMWVTASERMRADYIIAICVRMILGISDLADRNFCLYQGRVYSIDEDTPNLKEINVQNEIRGKQKIRLISTWVAENAQRLHGLISSWSPPAAPCFADAGSRRAKLLEALMSGSIL
jgi:hypothetical protein